MDEGRDDGVEDSKWSESGRRGHGEEEVRGLGASKISKADLFGVVIFWVVP